LIIKEQTMFRKLKHSTLLLLMFIFLSACGAQLAQPTVQPVPTVGNAATTIGDRSAINGNSSAANANAIAAHQRPDDPPGDRLSARRRPGWNPCAYHWLGLYPQ
jgi:hypothetical protein